MTSEAEKQETGTELGGLIDPVVMNFDPAILANIYSNIERIEDGRFVVYRVKDKHGNDAGMITCMKNSEIRIYVDNFPAQKKYFSCNYPVKTITEFENDIARTGLKLVRRGAQKLIEI